MIKFVPLIFLLNLVASPVAFAELPCGLLHNVDFQPAVEGLAQLGKPLSFMSAAVRVEVTGAYGSVDPCSGTFISDDGDLLTASHCLDACRFESTGKPNGNSTCKVKIKGVLHEMEIVKAGDCSFAVNAKVMEAKRSGDSVESFPENCRSGDNKDFAILRPKNRTALGEFSCLSLSEGRADVGSSVMTISYPSSTGRQGPNNPKAKDATVGEVYLSSGQIVSQTTCSKRWVAKNLVSRLYNGSGVLEEEIPLPPHLLEESKGKIQTTVDFVKGSSGSALINSKGEIVGSASKIIGGRGIHDNFNECRGSTIFEPAPTWEQAGLKSRCETHKADSGHSI